MHTIDHIGILVADLESAILQWSELLGCAFSPIGRYRSTSYVDTVDGAPHPHDARFSVSQATSPYIELLEVYGTGSHAIDRVGFHHLAIRVDNAESESLRVAQHGIRTTAHSREPDGRMHICFTDPHDLNGISLEYISGFPGPIVLDDGSPVWRDPSTGRASLWGPR